MVCHLPGCCWCANVSLEVRTVKVLDQVKVSFTFEELEIMLRKYVVDKCGDRVIPPLSSVKWLADEVILYFNED